MRDLKRLTLRYGTSGVFKETKTHRLFDAFQQQIIADMVLLSVKPAFMLSGR
jgi:hypothetical protein